MKKVLLVFFYICIFLCGNKVIYAKEGIESIDMNIYIDEFGNADVTEIWKCEAYSGTEWYHPYYNLDNAKILNLAVSGDGKSYTKLSSWNPGASHEDKKGKYGINKISNGIEICWGMGNYGFHEYEINYTIENFVDVLNDSQMIYWTLVPHNRSDDVENVSIKITAYKDFNDEILVWGFGEKDGTCRVYDGYIEMKSNKKLKKAEYMTLLIKLPKDFFSSTNKVSKNFEYFYNMATEDTTIKSGGNDILEYIETFLYIVGIIVAYIFIPIFMATGLSMFLKGYEKLYNKFPWAIPVFILIIVLCLPYIENYWLILIVALVILLIANITIKEDRILSGSIRKYEIPYYKDIPCDKDIFKAYYIAYQYGILKRKTDFIGALILKWIKENKAYIINNGSNNKKNGIQLIEEFMDDEWENIYEKRLYKMMYEASLDGFLEKNELKKWCKNKYGTVFHWLSKVLSFKQEELIDNKEIFVSGPQIKPKYVASDEVIMEGIKISGLKKYLREYTLISKRTAIEVHLFEEYLIMAQMLGISKKVIKQFKDLYPEMIEKSCFEYSDYIFVYSMVHGFIRTASFTQNISGALRNTIDATGNINDFSGSGRSYGGGRWRLTWWWQRRRRTPLEKCKFTPHLPKQMGVNIHNKKDVKTMCYN